jgi:hypothetical protein
MVLDSTRRTVHETVCNAVLWFDGLFGDHTRETIESARGSYGKIQLSETYSQFFGEQRSLHFSAHVDLPNLRNRVSAFIGREPEGQFVRDRSEGFALQSQFPQLDDKDETIAGLGYQLPSNYFFRSDFRAGVRFAGFTVPKLFAQWRLSLNAYADEDDIINLRTTPFVNTVDGFGDTSSVDYSHVLGPKLLLRWDNTATRTQKSPGIDWRSVLILYQALPDRRGLAYEAFVRGFTQAPVQLFEYGVQLVYRQPLFSERLYAEALAGYAWPKTDPRKEREGSYNVGLALVLPFGPRGDVGLTAQTPPLP